MLYFIKTFRIYSAHRVLQHIFRVLLAILREVKYRSWPRENFGKILKYLAPILKILKHRLLYTCFFIFFSLNSVRTTDAECCIWRHVCIETHLFSFSSLQLISTGLQKSLTEDIPSFYGVPTRMCYKVDMLKNLLALSSLESEKVYGSMR